jgi:hypothetical protein
LGGTSKLTVNLAAVAAPGADPFWSSDHSWKVIDVGGSTSGNFTILADGGPYTAGAFSTMVDGSGNVYLKFTAVPEPATVAMLFLACLALAGYTWRSR